MLCFTPSMMLRQDITPSLVRRKRALVIGNQNYPRAPLKNCVKDAMDLTKLLKRYCFTVTCETNANRQEMIDLRDSFIQNTKKGDLVLFFYSGHGIQYNQNNYLIPIDAEDKLNTPKNIKDHCVEVQDILNELSDRTPYLVIFILDCCRTNFFENNSKGPGQKGSGLHPLSVVPSSIVFYACAPGTVADDGVVEEGNSLFTKHLLTQLQIQKKSLLDIFASVTRNVYIDSKTHQLPSSVNSVMIEEPIYLNDEVKLEFDEGGNFKEVYCKGRRCAKCGLCRDWYFTGDSETWKWVQVWKNWGKEDRQYYFNNDVYELWQKRTDGATCSRSHHGDHAYTATYTAYSYLHDYTCVCEENDGNRRSLDEKDPSLLEVWT